MKRSRLSFAAVLLITSLFVWVVSGVVAGYDLRQNNLRMLELREAVFSADAENGDVNQALRDLQQYVTTTMNTTLPKLGDQKAIQLKATYDRLLAAEQARVSEERQRINQEAASFCEATLPNVRLIDRVPCVQEYTAARPVEERAIQKELYTFDFISPRWSSDLAGWSIVIFVISGALSLVLAIYLLLVRRAIRQRLV